MCQEYQKGDFYISTDKSLLDLESVHGFLQKIYWADQISSDVIRREIEHSVCFGMYHRRRQIGFARIVTNFLTIAYITDMFISEEYDETDLCDWFLECMLAYPRLHHIKKWILASKEGLYSRFTFKLLISPGDIPPSVEINKTGSSVT